ncbi:extracellular solute-binding protein [Butyrivibrio sp. YAB3001]|uniref:extracellular solute-binding protein n=1 Tax=Butyrivibrio sp. YAB3001 TaxID=1520812 RepID=UPI0008F6322A|nr:extracellular solute-binding protein [Butyrivibrio sp. YAB3001]SFB75002.1 ABC-type glycerol-3-phosphate transport system, substrate-binding protein [Butyrivibrio sp. YAB3001]
MTRGNMKNISKLLGISLGICIAAGTIGENNISYAADDQEKTSSEITSTERLTSNYSHVSAGYKKDDYKGDDVDIVLEQAITEGKDFLTADDHGYGFPVADIGHGDKIKLSVNVPSDGLYWLSFDYLSYDKSILPIELALTVDGEYPFYEARSISFETTWIQEGDTDIDRYGNEIVALPDKLIRWENKYLGDASYRYSEPLKLELESGEHEFEITVKEGTLLLGNLRLVSPTEPAEYQISAKTEGNNLITIEAEDFYERNNSSIHAAFEYDSSLTPLSAKEKVLNIIDEESFDTAGQRVTYSFNVEQAGSYNLAMNYRQSEKNDFPVFADIRIDGEIPNTAFKGYSITASTDFVTRSFTDEDGNLLSVYLEPGQHTISITLVQDKIRFAVEKVDEIMSGISDLSLEVTKVAGTNKDKYRDLKLTRYIPDLEDRLNNWIVELRDLADEATVFVGAKKGSEVAAFSYLLLAADQLESLAKEPDELVYRVDELSTSVNSINTQIANFVDLIGNNNLAIDRIYLYQSGAKLPKKMGIFASAGMNISRFVNSFFGQSYSSSNTNKEHVQVWVNRPRQYVEIMQKMIDEQFTPQTGIDVDLCLMTDAQKLILSNASGDTPDIATGINYSIPFDLAIRGALVDLTKFDNYKEVFGRYSDGLLVPSVVGDGLYSLPETMNFYVLFYRTDILEKLGLSAPDTMDELIGMLTDLQMRGLNVYYPTAAMMSMRNYHGTTPLIYQNGGKLYGDTALDIELDSEETVEGFTQLTELFTLYNLPVDVPNFYQHFRNGDLPLGIADFNSYNLILNAAPEIANSWDIALIPGIRDEKSGEILRYTAGGAESTVMFHSTDEREKKAWKFMEWWSDAQVQAEFGQRLQILYGDEYIWPTANLEAFSALPYPTDDKEVIIEQAKYMLEAPRLLGGYMMERETSNAFNDIVVNGDTVRFRIDEAVKTVKRETQCKLEEFGYIDSDGNVLEEYVTPSVSKVREIMER